MKTSRCRPFLCAFGDPLPKCDILGPFDSEEESIQSRRFACGPHAEDPRFLVFDDGEDSQASVNPFGTPTP